MNVLVHFHVDKPAKKGVKGKRCGLESIDFMLNNKGTDLAFTLGDVDALTAKVFNQVDSGEFANFTSGFYFF